MPAATRYKAPKFLPVAQQVKWNALYDAGLKQAKVDTPDDEKAQHAAANKAANKMLIVPAPDSAEAIAKMPDWQVQSRGDKTIDGVAHRTLVTIDGRKYRFPIDPAQKPAA